MFSSRIFIKVWFDVIRKTKRKTMPLGKVLKIRKNEKDLILKWGILSTVGEELKAKVIRKKLVGNFGRDYITVTCFPDQRLFSALSEEF